MNRRRLDKAAAPTEDTWRRQWQAWMDQLHETAWKPRLAHALVEPEDRDLADRMLTQFMASDSRLAPLADFMRAMSDAIPKPYPVDLTKWPRDLPSPPDITAEQVEEFRKAAIQMAAAAVAAEALYISSAEALMMREERDGWKA